MIYTKNKLMRQNYKHYTSNFDKLPQCMHEAYAKPSYNKVSSYWEWCSIIKQNGGYNIRILSANCQQYTIGYLFNKDNTTYFGYITQYYHRYCKVEDLI